MENRSHALIAGFFILVMSAAVALVAWWLSERGEEMRDYLLVTQQSVTGLNPQAQVRYRGIRAGKVIDISIDPKDSRKLLVLIRIDDDIPITHSTTAKLNSQGVTGLSYVMLDDDGSDLRPLEAAPDDLPRIQLQSSTVDALALALGRVAQVFDEEGIRNLKRTLANVAAASEGMKEVPVILASVRKALSDANIARLNRILAQVEQTSGQGAPLTAEVRALVVSFRDLSTRIDQLGAEAGGDTLPRLNALLQSLDQSNRQLNRVLEHVDEAPQSLIFGRSPPPPGPGEAGFGPRP